MTPTGLVWLTGRRRTVSAVAMRQIAHTLPSHSLDLVNSDRNRCRRAKVGSTAPADVQPERTTNAERHLNHLNNYLASYTKRTPLEIFEEAQRRLSEEYTP